MNTNTNVNINTIMTKNIHTQLAECDFSTIEKDSKNLHFKNEYASLPRVLSVVKPELKKNGILLSSYIKEGYHDVLIITLMHVESGTSIYTCIKLLNMQDMQKWAACMTYANRIGLLSLLGLVADMNDEDGNNTLPSPPDRTKLTASTAVQNVSKEDIKNLWKLKKEAAYMKDKEKALKIEGFHSVNFTKLNDKSEKLELSSATLLGIRDWLKEL